jgi:hypothetical protein
MIEVGPPTFRALRHQKKCHGDRTVKVISKDFMRNALFIEIKRFVLLVFRIRNHEDENRYN